MTTTSSLGATMGPTMGAKCRRIWEKCLLRESFILGLMGYSLAAGATLDPQAALRHRLRPTSQATAHVMPRALRVLFSHQHGKRGRKETRTIYLM